ncbi:hypothetical protein ACHAQA_007872 [Verticillium albo-atrum]
MPARLKVTIVGASGVTGQSITQGLLERPEQYEVVALARQSSLEKPELLQLAELGATLRAVDLDGSVDSVAKLLADVDIVISTLTLLQLPQELKLISAAKQAGVGRYVPSFFGPVSPVGAMFLREKKEEILNHVKQLYLPYTVIDVGWWYQMVVPRPPSQEADPDAFVQPMPIIGDGDVKIALTDNRDIGRFVARIIADGRTLNRSVFAYGDLKTLNEAWSDVESISGVAVDKGHVSEKSLLEMINDGQPLGFKQAMAQYHHSLGVRGDNAPERARYLGYLDARELYPDMRPRGWKEGHPSQQPHAASASRRPYATAHHGHHHGHQPVHRWPSHPHPTPYDIFAIDKTTPYTKARFYELVKLYHPDTNPREGGHTAPPGHTGLPPAVRLERYRLVVLANTILSDPERRHAYDSHGAGWALDRRPAHEKARAADRHWRTKPGNAANNATWEDWERWHAERAGEPKPQQPLFMSNTHFVALILAAIAIGSAMQASRAGESAAHVVEQRGLQEIAINEALRRQGRETAGKGREERIEKFLRERDGWAFGVAAAKDGAVTTREEPHG